MIYTKFKMLTNYFIVSGSGMSILYFAQFGSPECSLYFCNDLFLRLSAFPAIVTTQEIYIFSGDPV